MSNFTKSIVYSGVVLVAGLVAVFTIYNNMAVTDGAGYANIEPAAGMTSSAPRSSGIVSGANSMAQEAGIKATQAVQNASKSIRDASDQGHVDGIEGETADSTEGSVEEAVETIVDEATDEALEGIPADATDAQVDAAEDAAEEAAEEVIEDAVDEAKDAAEEAAQEAAEDTAEGDDL